MTNTSHQIKMFDIQIKKVHNELRCQQAKSVNGKKNQSFWLTVNVNPKSITDISKCIFTIALVLSMHIFGDRSEGHIVLNVSDAGVCTGNSFGFSKGAVFARDLGPVNVICLEDEKRFNFKSRKFHKQKVSKGCKIVKFRRFYGEYTYSNPSTKKL